MTLHLDRERLAAAHRTIRSDLLAERTSAGHWVGKLSSSPLSTATAISALMLAEQSSERLEQGVERHHQLLSGVAKPATASAGADPSRSNRSTEITYFGTDC